MESEASLVYSCTNIHKCFSWQCKRKYERAIIVCIKYSEVRSARPQWQGGLVTGESKAWHFSSTEQRPGAGTGVRLTQLLKWSPLSVLCI